MQAQIVFKTIGKVCCDLWLENHQNIQVEERPCLFEGFFPICIPRHEDLQALGRSFLWSVCLCMYVGGPQHSAPNWSVKLQKPFVTWLPICRLPGQVSGSSPQRRGGSTRLTKWLSQRGQSVTMDRKLSWAINLSRRIFIPWERDTSFLERLNPCLVNRLFVYLTHYRYYLKVF